MFNIHTHFASKNSIVNAAIDNIPTKNYFSLGVHPNQSNETIDILPHSNHPNCIAIGECGLDKLVRIPLPIQIKKFVEQIELANQLQKPLIIHVVRAHSEVLAVLKNCNNKVPVIIHGFNNKKVVLDAYLQAGYYMSYGKAIMHFCSNAQHALEITPHHQLFLETDMSSYTIDVIYKKAAELLFIDVKELEKIIDTNFHRCFNASKLDQ
jgi:TatD DNase family protein